MIVMKFGGTSVGSIDAFAQVVKIVQSNLAQQAQQAQNNAGFAPGVVVVTSAMSGVTNMLIDAALQAAAGNEEAYQNAQTALIEKHEAVLTQFIEDEVERSTLRTGTETRLKEFTRLCSSIAILGELTPRGLDVVSGMGERLSAPILAGVLRANGMATEFVDAGDIVVTDAVHGGAEPLMDLTTEKSQARLLPLVEVGVVPVITGFVASTEEGVPTTLGRGGSDYSAAIFGAVLDANEIAIWTDVNGVLTADPRIVSNARTLPNLTYNEVAELAYYGAKVLHPKTVMPAIDKNIAIRVLNTFNPEHTGTTISGYSEAMDDAEGKAVKAVTCIRGMTLISISGRGMMGVPGIAARTFQSVSRVDGNVMMISQSSSEQSICLVVPEGMSGSVVEALNDEFSREIERGDISQVSGMEDVVIVAVVGRGMRGTPGLAGKIFTAVAKHSINVIAIAQGSSEINISFVVTNEQASDAVKAIHEAFELEKS